MIVLLLSLNILLRPALIFKSHGKKINFKRERHKKITVELLKKRGHKNKTKNIMGLCVRLFRNKKTLMGKHPSSKWR